MVHSARCKRKRTLQNTKKVQMHTHVRMCVVHAIPESCSMVSTCVGVSLDGLLLWPEQIAPALLNTLIVLEYVLCGW